MRPPPEHIYVEDSTEVLYPLRPPSPSTLEPGPRRPNAYGPHHFGEELNSFVENTEEFDGSATFSVSQDPLESDLDPFSIYGDVVHIITGAGDDTKVPVPAVDPNPVDEVTAATLGEWPAVLVASSRFPSTRPFLYCVSIIGHNPGTTTSKTTTTTTTTKPPATTTSATGPSPTQSGLITTCETFYKPQAGDTCQIIAQQKFPYIYSIPLFKRWNPAVGENCDNLLPGYYYCVATQLHHPMPGIIEGCTGYYQVQEGDSCWPIQQKYGITAAQFNAWNLLVGTTCASLWVKYFVCVGV